VSDLLTHLDAQVASAERLLATVNAQTEAIKTQDVQLLLTRLGDVQAELSVRKQLELERDRLIDATAVRLQVPAESVDLEAMLAGAPAEVAERARALSAQLRALLSRVQQVHGSNRALIRQELTFVDHLLRVLSGTPQAGYSPGGWTSTTHRPTVRVDARA
jgi:flagellar biosynthesis/type III secretory pathway chaperone